MFARVGSILKPTLSIGLLAGLAACGNNSPVPRLTDAGAGSSQTPTATGGGTATPTSKPSGGTATPTSSGAGGTTNPSSGSMSTPTTSHSGGGTANPTTSGSTTPSSGATPTPTTSPTSTPTPTPVAATKVGHMWVIMLENEDYAKSFGATTAPYLAQTLPAQGALLQNFYGTGHNSLDNYISLISGQGANPITQADCQLFQDFQGTYSGQSAINYQAVGQGCVYPKTVPNLADQMLAAKISWKGYMEDMGNDASRGVAATCGHPAVNAQDKTQTASATDNYATRHDPFMYFHSVIDDTAYCNSHVVNLKAMDADLTAVATTPAFNFIVPGLCSDGHDSTCASGAVGGLPAIDTFLKTIVPKITSSAAFKQDGLLLITFDESGGAQSDASGCCGNTSVNTTTPGIVAATDGSSGGGRIGAIAIAPQFIKPGTISTVMYSHYGLLRTWEDLMGLSYLGYANQATQKSFGADVFTLKMPVLPAKSTS